MRANRTFRSPIRNISKLTSQGKFYDVWPPWIDCNSIYDKFHEHRMILLMKKLSAHTNRYKTSCLSLTDALSSFHQNHICVIVVRIGAGNSHYFREHYFGKPSTRCLQASLSSPYLSIRFAQHKTPYLRIYRLLYFHDLPDSQLAYFTQKSAQVDKCLRAHSQSVPLRTLPLFQYILVHCLHTDTGTSIIFHVFIYQRMIHISNYINGTGNGA